MKLLGTAIALVCLTPGMQAQTSTAPAADAPASAAPVSGQSAPAQSVPPPAAPAQTAAAAAAAPAAPAGKTIIIPAGTKILTALKSAVDTKLAKPGDQVYLDSTFPVIVGDHVVIPEGMSVLGVIDSVERPGRVKGRAAVTMHFTTLILPNGTVVEIPSSVNAVPGAGGPTVKGKENTVKQAGTVGADARNVESSAALGAGVGAVAGYGGNGVGAGVAYGAAAGAGAGLIYTMLTRGKDVTLQAGQPLEMVLQRQLILSEKDVYVPPPGTGPQYVPADNQPKPLPKPKPQP